MSNYSLGFYFDASQTSVLLNLRTKNDWQGGLLNGIGGKQEEFEPMLDCMFREFYEETSIVNNKREWVNFCRLQCMGYYVECYFYLSNFDFNRDYIKNCLVKAEEKIVQILIKDIYNHICVPNIYWLVPMAISHDFRKGNKVTVNYVV